MIKYILILVACVLWIAWLERDIDCPECGKKMDRVGNGRHCKWCNKLYRINTFGFLRRWF